MMIEDSHPSRRPPRSKPLTFEEAMKFFPEHQPKVDRILTENKRNSLSRVLRLESENPLSGIKGFEAG